MIIARHIFWPVRKLGLAWNLKVLQWINVNERLTHYNIQTSRRLHYDFFKDLYRAVEIYGKALQINILHKVNLGMAFREKVCLQDGSNKSRLTVWLHKGPSIFNYRLEYFFIWDLMFLDWDSIFFTRWVPGLTITICNQNHWIYIHVSNFSIEKQYRPNILLHHSCS